MHESRHRRRFCNFKMEKCTARWTAAEEEERTSVQMMCKFYLGQAKCTHIHTMRSIWSDDANEWIGYGLIFTFNNAPLAILVQIRKYDALQKLENMHKRRDTRTMRVFPFSLQHIHTPFRLQTIGWIWFKSEIIFLSKSEPAAINLNVVWCFCFYIRTLFAANRIFTTVFLSLARSLDYKVERG